MVPSAHNTHENKENHEHCIVCREPDDKSTECHTGNTDGNEAVWSKMIGQPPAGKLSNAVCQRKCGNQYTGLSVGKRESVPDKWKQGGQHTRHNVVAEMRKNEKREHNNEY